MQQINIYDRRTSTNMHATPNNRTAKQPGQRYAHPLETLEELGLILDDLGAGFVAHVVPDEVTRCD